MCQFVPGMTLIFVTQEAIRLIRNCCLLKISFDTNSTPVYGVFVCIYYIILILLEDVDVVMCMYYILMVLEDVDVFILRLLEDVDAAFICCEENCWSNCSLQ